MNVAHWFEFLLCISALLCVVISVLVWHWKRTFVPTPLHEDVNLVDRDGATELVHPSQGVTSAGGLQEAVLAHANAFRAQLAELQAERDRGVLSEEEFAKQHDELARRLLEDTQALKQAHAPASEASTSQAVTLANDQAPLSRWQRMLQSLEGVRGLAVMLGVVFAVGSLVMYARLGEPMAWNANAQLQSLSKDLSSDEVSHGQSPQDLQEMVDDIHAKLQKDPNSWEAWLMLARVQRTREDFDASDDAFKHALALSENDDIQIERAEVLALKHHGNFDGEANAIIERVLKSNPDQPNALLLAGSAAFSKGQYKLALAHWSRVRSQVDEHSEEANSLDQVIGLAQQKMGQKSSATSAPSVSSSAGNAHSSVQGRLTLAASLKNQVSPSDTVFIYARDPKGSRMPIAILKAQVKDLPMNFELNDALAMSAGLRISQFESVAIHARISKSGQAMPEPTDLGVVKSSVKVGTQGLALQIEGLYQP